MNKRIFLCAILAGASMLKAQEVKKDTVVELSEINVVAELPITTEVVSKKDIEKVNLGQDMPILLQNATSVVATSDAGAGVGYTGLRIRGIAQNQINVTFNGVPVNDSESHGVYWVDFPDVSSSTGGVIIQRGVGTSSNGATSFGGSVNLETEGRNRKPFGEAEIDYGSFNTQKYKLRAGTGDFADGKWNIDARGTYQKSDGYIDRASSNLYSGALNIRYMPNPKTEIHLMDLYGHERTYQAWNGLYIDEAKKNPRYNTAGEIKNVKGDVTGFYKDEVDNYDQNHLHLYWKQKYQNDWRSKAALHYTRGIGYYQNYKNNQELNKYKIYGLPVAKASLIRKKWLNNHFYGGFFNLENKKLGNNELYFGIAANEYIGGHYGEIPEVIGQPTYKQKGDYYRNLSHKTEFTTFVKAIHKLDNGMEFFGDIQLRRINYEGVYRLGGQNDNEEFRPFDLDYTFVNPKVGVNYQVNRTKLYATYGLTHREPTRTDILEANAKEAESLHDIEVGARYQDLFLNIGINGYYMQYKNQLVLTGELNDVGSPIRKNVGDSYRMGLELDFNATLVRKYLYLMGNIALSKNENVDYKIEDKNKKVKNLGNTPTSYSPNIVSSVGLEFNPVESLLFGITNKYVGSQFVSNDNDSDLKLPAYTFTNINASYKIPMGGKKSLDLMLLVNNIFNKEYYSNGYNWGKYLYVYPQAGRNFLAGIKFKF